MPAERAKRPAVPPRGTLVAITWDDAAFSLDEHPEVLSLTTVGWLVRVTPKALTMASEQTAAGDYQRSFTVIPRSLVRAVLRLEAMPQPSHQPPKVAGAGSGAVETLP